MGRAENVALRRDFAADVPLSLLRDRRLERLLDTPAKISYKYEGVSPAGSHKAEHVGTAGLLQPPARHPPADHRDGRRPVGCALALATKSGR
jgi:hypothetical protein